MSKKLARLDSLSLFATDVKEIQFDHMETWEHSKLKPLSILIVVEKKTRAILANIACPSPAKGMIRDKSLKKYGKRKDMRGVVMRGAFEEIAKAYPNIKKIESDKSPLYPSVVRKIFPKAKYITYKGRRGCVTGQGEMKSGGLDPLFSLNHTCAMHRANMNRLYRRTWCTTKKLEGLKMHLDLYRYYHNKELI